MDKFKRIRSALEKIGFTDGGSGSFLDSIDLNMASATLAGEMKASTYSRNPATCRLQYLVVLGALPDTGELDPDEPLVTVLNASDIVGQVNSHNLALYLHGAFGMDWKGSSKLRDELGILRGDVPSPDEEGFIDLDKAPTTSIVWFKRGKGTWVFFKSAAGWTCMAADAKLEWPATIDGRSVYDALENGISHETTLC